MIVFATEKEKEKTYVRAEIRRQNREKKQRRNEKLFNLLAFIVLVGGYLITAYLDMEVLR